jgi:hypothetical protein
MEAKLKSNSLGILIMSLLIGVTLSCESSYEPSIIGAEYDGTDTIKIEINGNWSGYIFGDSNIRILGKPSNTYYTFKKVIDNPVMLSDWSNNSYSRRAVIKPDWKPGDQIMVWGINGVLGGAEFTVPE